MDLSGIISALRALPEDQLERQLCGVCCELLSVSGAAITATADDLPPVLFCSSDPTSARVEDLQSTLGEGPTIDARRLGAPVGEPDLTGPRQRRWVAFAEPAVAAGAAAVFAFPLRVGAVQVGVLTLYQGRRGALSEEQYVGALLLAEVLTHTILAIQAQAPPGVVAETLRALADRGAEVHQAAGMLAVRLGVGVAEALVRLRALAYVDGRSLADLAEAVVSGKEEVE